MQSLGILLLFVSTSILLSSCATSRKNIDLTKVGPDEGVFYGKIKVVMDDEDVTGNCYIGVRDPSGEELYYSLDDTGLFSGVTKTGENWTSQLRCRKGMECRFQMTKL